MPAPAVPQWPPNFRNITAHPPPPFHRQAGKVSPGFWVGVAVFIAIAAAWLVRYSYLANPHPLQDLERWLGVGQRRRTPISHYPFGVENEPPYIPRPQPAVIAVTRSRDTLPLYRTTTNFSNDVLQGLLSLETPVGGRPPSYRSRLSLGWEASQGDVNTQVAKYDGHGVRESNTEKDMARSSTDRPR